MNACFCSLSFICGRAPVSISECYNMRIPKMNPFEVADPIVLQSMQLTSILTSRIYWSNIKVYGFDKAVFQECRYVLIASI